MDKKSVRSISFFSILGFIFLAAKLFKVITWSWWLVLLPFYGPIVICLVIAHEIFAVAGFLLYLSDQREKKAKKNGLQTLDAILKKIEELEKEVAELEEKE